PNNESSSTRPLTDTHILRVRVEPSITSLRCPFAFSSSQTPDNCHPESALSAGEGSAFRRARQEHGSLAPLLPIASSYTIIHRKDPHATRQAIPPRSGHLRLSPRGPQNCPRRRRETLRRLRQHLHRTCGIALHLEGQTRTFPRTPAPHQNHRQAPQRPGKGSPPPPLLRHSRIPSSAHRRRLPSLPPLARAKHVGVQHRWTP